MDAQKSLFDPADRDALLARLTKLRPDAPRQWGKMDLAQALAHLSVTLEAALGERHVPQVLIGKLLAPFFRGVMLGPRPFAKNAPTGRALVVSDPRDFARERDRLVATIGRFVAAGPDAVARQPHGFLGRVTGDEWGRVQWKHVDHHLRQFGG